MVSAIRTCRDCADRQPGCGRQCTDRAVGKIMRIITEPERRAERQLQFDRYGMQCEHYIRRMRDKRRQTGK